MTPAAARAWLSSGTRDRAGAFRFLGCVGRLLATDAESTEAQELLIRALDRREAFEGLEEPLNALVREVGLFPYAEPERLSLRDRLALEAHRPEGSLGDAGLVFHREQAEVFRALMAGRNVVLSAPTSFGKSLVIDAVVASGRFRRIVVVVPTIALTDETRRRLARFSATHKVVTHASQSAAEGGRGTIFVLTQERVIEREDLDQTDFFVIDEFYKLDPAREADTQRSSVLNHAFYKLLRTGAQFYMLGPSIASIATGQAGGRFKAEFVKSDYATVVSDVERVDTREGKEAALLRVAAGLEGPALVYCKSPASVRAVVRLLMGLPPPPRLPAPELRQAAAWLARHYHPAWTAALALPKGIALHHGRLPRSLSQLGVRLFNDGVVRFLVCTSTLIEGVNTAAKHVLIYDNRVAQQKFDYFTFRNIQGRSGRMFRHFVGKVHLFEEAPQRDLLDVDFPALTQDDDAPDTLLVQLGDEDLRPDARRRVDAFRAQTELSFEAIRANRHVDPGVQIELARRIRREADRLHPILNWRHEPTNDQLYPLCELLFDTLLRAGPRSGVKTGRQLAFLVSLLRQNRSATGFLRARLRDVAAEKADDAVEDALEFLRNWAAFRFPRALMALETIQAEVFARLGRRAGSYGHFASVVENLMTTPALAALDEYGLPPQVVEKLRPHLRADGSLDAVLDDLRRLDGSVSALEPFEKWMLQSVREAL